MMTTVKLINMFPIITILGAMNAPETHPLCVLLAFEAVLLSLVIKHLSKVHYFIIVLQAEPQLLCWIYR